jgi:hypothetical protein
MVSIDFSDYKASQECTEYFNAVRDCIQYSNDIVGFKSVWPSQQEGVDDRRRPWGQRVSSIVPLINQLRNDPGGNHWITNALFHSGSSAQKLEDATCFYCVTADQDADEGKLVYIPEGAALALATFILRTSIDEAKGTENRQFKWFYTRLISIEKQRRICELIRRKLGGDDCITNLVQPFRIPGTFNNPDLRKIKRGRSPERQLVSIIGGLKAFVDPDVFIAQLEALPDGPWINATAASRPQSSATDRTTGGGPKAAAKGLPGKFEPNLEYDLERAAAALKHIPADDRQVWLEVGMALHGEFGDAGRQPWEDWSQQSQKFNPADQEKTWRSFKRQDGAIKKLGSLIALAKRYGYQASGPAGTRPGGTIRGAFDGSAARKLDSAPEREEAAEHAPGAQKPGAWPELQPIAKEQIGEPYPVGALPVSIREAVMTVAEVMCVPYEMPAMSALAAISAAAQGLADVRRSVDARLSGPISLFLMIIAGSGSRKTQIDKLFTSAIAEVVKAMYKKLAPEIKRAIAERAAWEAKRKGIEERIRKNALENGGSGKTGNLNESRDSRHDELEKLLVEHEKKEPAKLMIRDVLKTEGGTEALIKDMVDVWPTAAFIESEGGSALGNHSFQKDRITKTLGDYNKLWEAADLGNKRISRESVRLEDGRLTLCLQVQQAVIDELCGKNNKMAREIGFLARFLVAKPHIRFGERLFTERPMPEIEPVRERIKELFSMPIVFNRDDHGKLTCGINPPVLDLSPDAKAEWVRAYNGIEVKLREFGDYADVKDASSRAGENIARLAALFHVYEHGPAGQISIERVLGAEQIVLWHLAEYKRMFVGVTLSDEERDADKLERWLIKHCREKDCTAANYRLVHACVFRNNKEGKGRLDKALELLTEAGRAHQVKIGRQQMIEIQPGLIEGGECPF